METPFKDHWIAMAERDGQGYEHWKSQWHGKRLASRAIAEMIEKPEHLVILLSALDGVEIPVNPLFLATRPAYMPRKGDPYCPTPTYWVALFDMILSDPKKEDILTMTEEEMYELAKPLLRHRNFEIAWWNIRVRWRAGARKVWHARRQRFMTSCAQEIIREAMRPSRVERILELGGFETLDAMFLRE
jgi:hypothetical protein